MYYVVHVHDVFQVMFHPQLLLKWQTCMLQVQVLLKGWMYHTAAHFTVMMKHFGAILFPLGEGGFFFVVVVGCCFFFVCFCLFLFFLIYFNLLFFLLVLYLYRQVSCKFLWLLFPSSQYWGLPFLVYVLMIWMRELSVPSWSLQTTPS